MKGEERDVADAHAKTGRTHAHPLIPPVDSIERGSFARSKINNIDVRYGNTLFRNARSVFTAVTRIDQCINSGIIANSAPLIDQLETLIRLKI